MEIKPLPIGIDNFNKLIRGGYYYVDKTWLIKEQNEKNQSSFQGLRVMDIYSKMKRYIIHGA